MLRLWRYMLERVLCLISSKVYSPLTLSGIFQADVTLFQNTVLFIDTYTRYILYFQCADSLIDFLLGYKRTDVLKRYKHTVGGPRGLDKYRNILHLLLWWSSTVNKLCWHAKHLHLHACDRIYCLEAIGILCRIISSKNWFARLFHQ